MRLRDDIVQRALGQTAKAILRRPWAFIWSYALLTVCSVIASLLWLGLVTDQNELVSNDLEYNQRFLSFNEEFGDLEYLYVVIEVRDLERSMAIADAVADEMRTLPDHVKRVFHRVSMDPRGALVFVPKPLLDRVVSFVEEHSGTVRALQKIESLDGLCRFVVENVNATTARENPRAAKLGMDGLVALMGQLERAAEAKTPELPDAAAFCTTPGSGVAALVAGALASAESAGGSPASDVDDLVRNFCGRGYLYTGDLVLVAVLPVKDFESLEVIREPLRVIRASLKRVRDRFPDDVIGLTGRPVLQADEMETTSRDMTQAAILAILAVLTLFIIFFREILRPTLAALTLVSGICMTFGLVTLAVGHLNLLTMVFTVMLVGMGMEFGIHLLARYREELAATGSVDESIRNAVITAGKGNVTGATTTAAAFYTMMFVDFQGLAELGFISGSGLLLCMVAMNTVLPALIVVVDRRRPPRVMAPPLRLGVLGFLAARPAWTLPLFGLAFVAGLPLVRGVSFDANLLDLQAVGLRSVEFEKRLVKSAGQQTWFAAYIVDSRDDVRSLTEQLRDPSRSHAIGKVESILDYVPDDQSEKIDLIRRLGGVLGIGGNGNSERDWAWSTAVGRPVDVDNLSATLDSLLERLESLLSGTLQLDGEGAAELESLTDRLDRLIEKLAADPVTAQKGLDDLQVAWGQGFAELQRGLAGVMDPTEVSVSDLDPLVRQRVLSSSGRHLVLAYPGKDIWVEENMEEFIVATREVDKAVTGVPVQVYESTRIMKHGFIVAAVYSLIAVFFLIFFDFRSLLFTCLAMIPVVVGLTWVAELMPVFDMSFNLANFFAIPILIGEGINGGVHIIHRFREDRSAQVATRSTGSAVALSYLNTLTGFGMLLFAHHRGVAGLGAMMVLGSAASLVASTLVLPSVLKLVERRRWHAGTE